MKAFFTLKKLSAEEKNLLLNKQIADTKTPDEWIAFFQKLRDFDKESDSARKWSGGLGCLGIVISFFSFFLLAIYVGFLTIFIGLFLAIAGLIAYFHIKKYDIPGEILTNRVIPILFVLREEMKANEKFKLNLDLRGFEMQEKLLRQTPDYGGSGAYRSLIDYFYRDQWMTGEAVLADDSRLIWSLSDLVKHTKKIKYRKGKRKSKSKYRSHISVQIGMNKSRYLLPPRLKQKGQEGLMLTKKSGDYNWMKITKIIKHAPGQSFAPDDFINAIASAYTRAEPQGGKN